MVQMMMELDKLIVPAKPAHDLPPPDLGSMFGAAAPKFAWPAAPAPDSPKAPKAPEVAAFGFGNPFGAAAPAFSFSDLGGAQQEAPGMGSDGVQGDGVVKDEGYEVSGAGSPEAIRVKIRVRIKLVHQS